MNEPTYLNVAYAEKDLVKSLGARWDAMARRWFVPEGVSLEGFSQWLKPAASLTKPATDSLQFDASELAAVETLTQGMRLSELISQANRALRLSMPTAVWVIAEITEMSQRQGHLYLTLAESVQGQQLAQVKANIWSNSRERILTAFERTTGQQLSAGMSILICVEVAIHARFGLSLTVTDINPSFTLGDQEAKLQQIRQSLKKLGIGSLNKQKKLPQDLFRIAVLAPAQAAGLGDFRSDANQLTEAGLCEFDYYHASFQGVSAVTELKDMLTRIAQFHDQNHYDALVIIRGGGAKQDLMFLNDFNLAEAVCRFPIPVLTGIGHERDSTILDEVAFTAFDTPSKVVSFIRQHIVDVVQTVQSNWLLIQSSCLQHLTHARALINEFQHQVQQHSQLQLQQAKQALVTHQLNCEHGAKASLSRQDQQLTSWYKQLQMSVQHLCSSHKQQLDQWQQLILPYAQHIIKQHQQKLSHYHQLIQTQHPKRLLGQGYVLARDPEGKLLTSAVQVASLTEFKLDFVDGHLMVQPLQSTLNIISEPN